MKVDHELGKIIQRQVHNQRRRRYGFMEFHFGGARRSAYPTWRPVPTEYHRRKAGSRRRTFSSPMAYGPLSGVPAAAIPTALKLLRLNISPALYNIIFLRLLLTSVSSSRSLRRSEMRYMTARSSRRSPVNYNN
jgi:hypothetical protein